MQVNIHPSSGYDNSYYDIQYKITFEKDLPESEFKLFFLNTTNDTRLNILATSNGYIDSDGYVVVNNPQKTIYGYINLFNDDKMNIQLEGHKNITLKCVIETESQRIEKDVLFFNESFSADQGILPFELYVENNFVDISVQEPLRLKVVADCERSFHLAIQAEYGRIEYGFYVFTKKGQISIEIPAEILNHELSLYKTIKMPFHLCFMKPHGVNYENVVNEKRITIPNTNVKFTGVLELAPQTRYDPVNRELSYSEFLPSDRYFVPTLREHSFFGRYKPDEAKNFYSQLMTSEFIYFRQVHSRNPILPSEKIWKSEERRPVTQKPEPNQRFFSTMSSIYTNITNQTAPYVEQLKVPGQLNNVNVGGGGCAGCARKRKQASQNQ